MAAAFSRHLAAASDHLAAAARHLAGAARAATGRRSDNSDHANDDAELGLSSSSSSSSSDSSSGDGSNGGEGVGGAGGDGSDVGTGGGDGGDADADADDGDNVEAILTHCYELFGVPFGIGLPLPVYWALPLETRDGAAWVWCLLTYAVVSTIGVTFISVRVFRSQCCLSTTLRALLLVVCLLTEVFAAFHLLPISSSYFAAVGAGISVCHLMAVYLGAWALSRRH